MRLGDAHARRSKGSARRVSDGHDPLRDRTGSNLPAVSSSASIGSFDVRPDDAPQEIVALKASAALQGFTTRTCPQCGIHPAPAAPVNLEVQKKTWVAFALASFSALFFGVWWARADHAVDVWLPVCAECADAHRRGVNIRKLGLGALAVSPGLLTALAPLFDPGMGLSMFAFGAWAVAGVAACVAAYRMTRKDVIRWLRTRNDVMLLAASKSFVSVVAKEAPEAFPFELPPRP
jgi:hypothetical protein